MKCTLAYIHPAIGGCGSPGGREGGEDVYNMGWVLHARKAEGGVLVQRCHEYSLVTCQHMGALL